MVITIHSSVHGTHNVIYDDSDHDIVSKHTWCLHKRKKGGGIYAVTNTKRPNKKLLSMEHVIMGSIWIDHINLDSLDNRRINLRKATRSQNAFNHKVKRDCKSGYKGVGLIIPKYGKPYYQVACCAHGKRVYGGVFSDPIVAAKRYNELAMQLHGEFANLNKI